jgi:hypothetical protein
MVYLYDASDQISDFCHQQLLRKMRRKISWTEGRTDGRTDGQTDRGKTVYPHPPASYMYSILCVAFLVPSDAYVLFADLVGFYTHWSYMHIFRHIFLSNCWWQRSDIWSQASFRYPISWEAFLDPSDSYFLCVDFVDFSTHWTYILYMPIFSLSMQKALASSDKQDELWVMIPPLFGKQEVGI